MRGAPGNTNASLRWNTPHPSRRCAPIHLLPQGEKEEGPRYILTRSDLGSYIGFSDASAANRSPAISIS
ncbi:MAG: hypothetical protein E5W75_06930 [Mesorhizobium sp.]|nr:MAG: hypothetical protein E5W75_06930 [Mesorhizobium sp.]